MAADVTHMFGDGRGTRVKICCMASEAEAELAFAAGADALGLVSAMPSGPGVITDERAHAIARAMQGRVATVLLTSRQSAEAIGMQLDHVRPSAVQVVDELSARDYEALRRRFPSVRLIQVIHVRDEQSISDAVAIAPFVDFILLDSGNPGAAVKELGGTGRVHDWTLSRAIRDAVATPVFLAGGLNAGNVASAIATVQPFGVDVCSGVRDAEGRLDPTAVRSFIHTVRRLDVAPANIDATSS